MNIQHTQKKCFTISFLFVPILQIILNSFRYKLKKAYEHAELIFPIACIKGTMKKKSKLSVIDVYSGTLKSFA